MCIAEQSGICKAGGPAHLHSWQRTIVNRTRVGNGKLVHQLCGIRDDGQAFYVNGYVTIGMQSDDDVRARMLPQLDLELKCCTCLGNEHAKENVA